MQMVSRAIRAVSEFKPTLPYLLFHPRFIMKNENKRWQYQKDERYLINGIFRKDCYAIDIDCRKFLLTDVINRGSVWALWNIPGIRAYPYNRVKVEYVFGPPEQLTFDQARAEYVEYACAHCWWSSSHENEMQFRARNAKYANMYDLMEFVSLAGNLPKLK